MSVNRDLAAAFMAHPQDTFLSAMATLRDVVAERDAIKIDLDMMGDYVDLLQREHEALDAECKRLRLRLEIANCASDHAVMFADGEQTCGCGWEEPS